MAEDHPLFLDALHALLTGLPEFEVAATTTAHRLPDRSRPGTAPDIAVVDLGLADGKRYRRFPPAPRSRPVMSSPRADIGGRRRRHLCRASRRSRRPAPSQLSAREHDILAMIAKGLCNPRAPAKSGSACAGVISAGQEQCDRVVCVSGVMS